SHSNAVWIGSLTCWAQQRTCLLLVLRSGAFMSSKRTVLIVDDDASVGDALRVVLLDRGYDALVVTNGRDALEAADSDSFDVAIIDVGLPDMSGLELLSVLQTRDAALRIIIMTALPSPDILSEATRL